MISTRPSNHSASYDEDGNIILHEDAVEPEVSADNCWRIEDSPPPSPEEIFDASEVDLPDDLTSAASASPVLLKHFTEIRTVTGRVFEEGVRQYFETIVETPSLLRRLRENIFSSLGRVRQFLTQPVWVPGRKREAKKYNRGMLFVFDVIRFGGTFGMIFLLLFVTLNYQSFWQIAKARVEPLLSPPSISVQRNDLTAMLSEQLKLVPSLTEAGGKIDGDLVSFLPEVGPPENRVIIPKLELNVELVNPEYDALLKGDWSQVEKDIQTSLQDGVVHYPGTAKPGQAGNFFVTGHSSYYPWAPGKFKTVFARLHELDIGDEYWVYFGGDKHRYIVRSKKEVSPANITVLDQPTDKRISTLMTCTPVGTTLRRLIVTAEEVDLLTSAPLKVGERTSTDTAPKIKIEALPI